MLRSQVQGLTTLASISEIVCNVASSSHAKFHAFITKVNNSAIFWTIIAVLTGFSKNVFAKKMSRMPLSARKAIILKLCTQISYPNRLSYGYHITTKVSSRPFSA